TTGSRSTCGRGRNREGGCAGYAADVHRSAAHDAGRSARFPVHQTRTEGVPLLTSDVRQLNQPQRGSRCGSMASRRTGWYAFSLVPALLTRVGVVENGKPVPCGQMTERLRNEIESPCLESARQAYPTIYGGKASRGIGAPPVRHPLAAQTCWP